MNMSESFNSNRWGDIATELLNKVIKYDCSNMKQLKVDVRQNLNFPDKHHIKIIALMNTDFNNEEIKCAEKTLEEARKYLKIVAKIFKNVPYLGLSIMTVEMYDTQQRKEEKMIE
jgi:hypothetical protein